VIEYPLRPRCTNVSANPSLGLIFAGRMTGGYGAVDFPKELRRVSVRFEGREDVEVRKD
jgi:hypothetical protein